MKKKQRKCRELNLSDSFMKSAFTGQAALECRALILNINLGHNQELLESCKVLWEYSYFINEVRENQKQGLAIETAVQEAQKSCIEKDILKEFLEQNSAEVSDVILEEFDQEKYEEDLRRESWEDGKIAGMEIGKERTACQSLPQTTADFGAGRKRVWYNSRRVPKIFIVM